MTAKKRVLIYFAGSYETKCLVDWLANTFCDTLAREHAIEALACSRWHRIRGLTGASANEQRVAIDFDDIDQADFVVSVYPYGYGTSAELGYAVGKGKTVVYVADHDHWAELPFAAYHVAVRRVSNVESALSFIADAVKTAGKQVSKKRT